MLDAQWQNPARPADVNNDGIAVPLDALLVLNRIRESGTGGLPQRNNPLDKYYDVSGDSSLTPLDALLVLNEISRGFPNGNNITRRVEGESEVAPAGFISMPLTALPGQSGELVDLRTSLTIGSREFNEMGVFVVDTADGMMGGMSPSSPGYADAVFGSGHRHVLYSRHDILRDSRDVTLPAGSHIRVYVLQAYSDDGDPTKHIRVRESGVGGLRIGWEEQVVVSAWPIVGDRYFDDVIVDAQIGVPYGGNARPQINFIPNQTVAELTELQVQSIAVDADLPNDTLSYSLDAAPLGVAINATTGLLRWTPTETQGPGNFPITIRVTDREGAFDTRSFQVAALEINLPPVLQPIGNRTVQSGEPVVFVAQAADPDLPANQLTFSLDTGSPVGAVIHAQSGEFSWSAPAVDAVATYEFTIRVSDNSTPSLSATQSFVVTVTPVTVENRTPKIESIADQTIPELEELRIEVIATDADLPNDQLTYSLETAPLGVIIEPSTGVLTWTPAEAQGPGTYPIIIRVTDQAGAFDTDLFQVSVLEVNLPPVISPIANRTVQSGEIITFTAQAADPDLPANQLAFSLDAGNAFGSSIDASSGAFTWTAPEVDVITTYFFTARVTDNGSPSVSASQSFMIAVDPGIPDCIFDDQLTGWNLFESGGSSTGRGAVVAGNCSVTITEGDSFVVGLERSFTVPDTPTVIQFTYDNLTFDTTDPNFIKDTFEVALTDVDGMPLTFTIDTGRDAFFNITEGLPLVTGAGIAFSGSTVTIGLDPVLAGTVAKIAFRLVSNDRDRYSSVQIDDFRIVSALTESSLQSNLDRPLNSIDVVTNLTSEVPPLGNSTRSNESQSSSSLLLSRNVATGNAVASPAIRVSQDSANVPFDGKTDLYPTSIVNGGLELDSQDVGIETVYPGESYASWESVGSGDIEFVNGPLYSVGPVYEGTGFVDLNGVNFTGAIQQRLTTTPGQHYEIGFLLSGNPQQGGGSLGDKTMDVFWNNQVVGSFTFVHQPTDTWQSLRWDPHTVRVTAKGNDILKFASTTTTYSLEGPFLDAITVRQLDNQQSPTILIDTPGDNDQFSAGSKIVISGHARASSTEGKINSVTVNGIPVNVLDSSGHFFSTATVKEYPNLFKFEAIDSFGLTATTTLTLVGVSRQEGGLDFSRYSDITGSFSGRYFRTSFNEQAKLLHVDLATRNDGQFVSDVPLLVGVKNISDPSVRLVGFDGFMPDGTPYYDYSDFVAGGRLQPGQLTDSPTVLFRNPNRVQFDYELVFLGKLNEAPYFTSVPSIEAIVARTYTYDADADDPDQDLLTFELMSGPAGMMIDATSGKVTWIPGATDVGMHSIAIRAHDGRGGFSEQHYKLNSILPPTNRPPVFTSAPNVRANVHGSYKYNAMATDPDEDTLNFVIDQAPAGLTIDSSTGVLAWEPNAQHLGPHRVVVRVLDDAGGEAVQSFFIQVSGEPGNHAPVITSTPPTFVHPVTPKLLLTTDSTWRGTGTEPGVGWDTELSYDDSSQAGWGEPGMFNIFDRDWIWFGGTNGLDGPTTTWYRKEFSLDRVPASVQLYVAVDDDAQVFVNGNLVLDDNDQVTSEATIDITSALVTGSNLIAIRGIDYQGYRYFTANLTEFSAEVSYNVDAFDPDDDPLTYSLITAPVGMNIDSGTGDITWAPTNADFGSHLVNFNVDDGRGGITSQQFTLTVSADNNASISGSVYLDRDRNGTQSDPGIIYNANADFVDPAPNPNGVWSYGYSTSLGGAFVPFDEYVTFGTGFVWRTDLSLGTPGFGKITTGPNNGVATGETFLHGGPGGELAILRFTAPSAGTYSLSATWGVGDLGNVDIYVYQDSTSLLSAPNTAIAGSYSNSLTLASGEKVDLIVGIGEDDFFFDSTPVNLIMSLVTDEPGLFNRVVFLDENRNGTRDAGERFSKTDAAGGYTFAQLPAGSYVVHQEGQLGFSPTSPVPPRYNIDLQQDQIVTGLNFGNIESLTSTNRSPSITSLPPLTANAGQAYLYRVATSDLDGDALTYDLPSKPVGMGIDSRTGVIAWTPTQADVTDPNYPQNIVVRVRDGRGGQDVQVYRLRVLPGNSEPVIVSTPMAGAFVDIAYSYPVRAQDSDGDTLTFSLGQSPPGMTIDAMTGLLTWIPAVSQLGNQSVVIRVDDGRGNEVRQSFSIAVTTAAGNRSPIISSNPRQSIGVNQIFSYAVVASDPDGDRLTYQLTTSPIGMTIDDQGLIQWQPTISQFGQNHIGVRIEDGRGGFISQDFVVNVSEQTLNRAPSIISVPPTRATSSVQYIYDAQAIDPDRDPIIWSFDVAPLGMSLDSARGTIRWNPTPEQFGDQTVILRATDSLGASAVQTFAITVRLVNEPPDILSDPPTQAAVDVLYTYPVRSIDADGDKLTFSLLTFPPGMTINSSTGLVRWTPTTDQLGPQRVVINAEDLISGGVLQSYIVVVSSIGPNEPPQINSTPAFVATIDQPYSYQVAAIDLEGAALSYALLNKPEGMTINAATGLLQWTPSSSQLGPSSVEVAVADPAGNVAKQAFTIRVLGTNRQPSITSTPLNNATSGGVYRYDIRATDPDGDSLIFTLNTAPAGMSIDALGRINWSPAFADIGSHPVLLTVSDGRGGLATQPFDIAVVSDNLAPKVGLSVTPNPADLGSTITIVVSATDNVGVAALGLTRDGVPVVLDSSGRASIVVNAVGAIQFVATARDGAGNTGTTNQTLIVRDPRDVAAPTVDLITPAEDAVITAPTDIIGTVTDDNLLYYTLEVARYDSDNFLEIARGTTSVTNGLLGRFDPSTLSNDTYRLRLTAFDAGGHESTVERMIDVAGDLKLGNFTLSFTDLTIPVSGVPITVTRTYDTLNADVSDDFGYGWRMEFRDTDLRTNVPQTGLEEDLIYNPFVNGTKVFVTLPGGKRERFTFQPQLAPGLRGSFLGIFYPNFVADPGVTSQLSVPRFELSVTSDGSFIDYSGGLAYNPVSPVFGGRFVVTTEEGLAYEINGTSGDLTSIIDPVGNTLTFTDDSITSSTGNKVTFERNPQNRITAVVDPAGNKIRYGYDALGNLVSVTDRQNNVTQFLYEHAAQPHYLTKIVDPLGRNGIRAEYDDQGKLVKMIDAAGKSIELIQDPGNFTQTVKDQLGNSMVYEYDTLGNIVREVDANGGVTLRTYSDPNNPSLETSITNALGHTTRFTYDARGNQLTSTDPLGNVTYSTYQNITFGTTVLAKITGSSAAPFSVPLTTTDPLGNTTTNTYDTRGNLLSINDPSGLMTSLSYDGSGNPTTMNLGGNSTQFTYDGAGRVTSQTDILNSATTYTYDTNGNQLTETRTLTTPNAVRTLVTTREYDKNNRVISVKDPEGNITRTEYNAAGNRLADVDALGRRTEYRYDERGLLIETIFPDATPGILSDNPRTRIEYDAAGRETARIDESGRRTEFQYDKLGRKTFTIYPDATPGNPLDNPRTQTVYDAVGQVIAQIDERGNRTEFVFDAAGRQIEVVLPDDTPDDDSDNPRLRTEYDASGRSVAQIDPLGTVTRFVYDDAGRPLETIYADGTKTRSVIDAAGRLTQRIDQAGLATDYEYDALGRLTAVVLPEVDDPFSGMRVRPRTEYEYDELGGLVVQRDALGNETRYEYDGRGRRTATVLPLGQRATSQYDAVGRMTAHTDFNGDTITFGYDARDQLSAKRFPDGTSVSFTYTATGQRETYTDARGVTTWEYDERGRLAERTDPDGVAIGYTYDAAGNRTSVTIPSGATLYTFDAQNRLKTVTDSESGVTSYAYDLSGRPIETRFPNGVIETREYDELHRLEYLESRDPSGIVFDSYRYTLDAIGNRTRIIEASGRAVDYVYDELYRLTQEAIDDNVNGDRNISYLYDLVGNRMRRDDSAEGITTYSYDDNDRLLQEAINGIATAYRYDDNGNTVAKSVNGVDKVFYDWDVENRLIAVDTNANGINDVAYEYDADGIRVSKTVNPQASADVIRFLIDANRPYQEVLEEYTPGGIIKVSYVHGLDLISQNSHDETGKSFYHVDGLGSTRALSDELGIVTDRYIYDAFGQTIGQVGATGNVYLFAGEQRDLATGLDYLRARYMSPSVGRFVSRDTFEGFTASPASLHKYLYANANPANNIDPNGQFAISLGGILAGLNASFTGYFTFGIGQVITSVNALLVTEFILRPAFELRNTGLLLVSDGVHIGEDLYSAGNQLIKVGTDLIRLGANIGDAASILTSVGGVFARPLPVLARRFSVRTTSISVSQLTQLEARLIRIQTSGYRLESLSVRFRQITTIRIEQRTTVFRELIPDIGEIIGVLAGESILVATDLKLSN